MLSTLVLSTTFVADAKSHRVGQTSPFPYAQKANHELLFEFDSNTNSPAKVAQSTPAITLTGEPNYGYLTGPDGTDWYYTVQYESTTITPPGFYEGYTETIISGYSFTVYNSNLEEVGKISDTLKFKDTETGVAGILLDQCVTKKFFNNNDNYEIVVSVAYNNPNYSVTRRSYVYSLGAAKDGEYDTPVAEIEGYIVSTVNAAADQWSENFYITFLTETSDPTKTDLIEYLESCKNILTIYKKAGWGSSCTLVDTLEVPNTHLPGDQQSAPFFLSFVKDGKAAFALSRYEKRFYESPVGDNENVIPDNKLQIFLYEAGYNGLEQTLLTEIPSIQSTEQGDVFTYYSIGGLGYTEDIDFGNFIDGETSFVITKEIYNTQSDDEQKVSYYIYDSLGNKVRTIAENIYGMKRLNDLPSYEPQYLFVVADGNQLMFQFMDIYSGNIVAELPQTFEGYQLTMSTDRCLGGESYMWGVLLNNTEVDNNNIAYDHVAWINADGQFIDHIDRINLGKDVAIAQINMSGNVLSPYLFNTDSDREYMILLKRYVGEGTETREELIICNSAGEALLTAKRDEQKGNLKTISVYNYSSTPQLCLVYSDGLTLTQDIYDLPLVKFSNGGEGTATNPYKISSIGDFQQIQNDLTAHYVLTNDIDAGDYIFKPITDDSKSFTGSIDGNGFTIRNLTIGEDSNYGALFGNFGEGATIRNINFENATILLSETASYAGLFAGQSIETKIENVHVYGLKTTGNPPYASFGGFVGRAALHTQVTNCSIENADINLPENTVGGFLGEALTGSSVTACKFSGKINGGSPVGGIIGSTGTGDEEVINCHVDADIIAKNSAGGIIGASKRSKVANCYVEGTIEVVGPSWGSACAGGIIGELQPNFQSTESDGSIAPADIVVNGCFVNISSIKGYEMSETPSYANEFTTIHRIVGRSSANEEPDNGAESYSAESAIANNYAVSTLALGQSNIEATATSVEGASIDVNDLTLDFLKGIGYAFGNTSETPWNELSITDPALYFERSIFFSPAEVNVKVGETFTLTIVINERNVDETVLDNIKVTSANGNMLKATGNNYLNSNTQPSINIEFVCESEGSTEVSVEYLGSVAKCTVNAIASGISDIVANPENLISIIDNQIIAEDCTISVYNLAGALIHTSNDSFDATSLTKGIYLLVAVSDNGDSQSLKIAVK